jgi:hypothetical protein
MTAEADVDNEWKWLLTRENANPEMTVLIQAASQFPALRRLFPYLSLSDHLRFSRSTEYPFSPDYPYVSHIREAIFELRAGDGRPVLRGSVEGVLSQIPALLPDPPDPVTKTLAGGDC